MACVWGVPPPRTDPVLPCRSLLSVKYSYIGIGLNELDTLKLYCSNAALAKNNGKCAITTGEQTIATLGLDQYTIGECAGLLVLYIVFCRTVAFLGIRYIKW